MEEKFDSFVEAAKEDNAVITKFAASEVDPVHLAKFRAARVAPMLASAARNVDGVVTSGKAKFAPPPLTMSKEAMVLLTR